MTAVWYTAVFATLRNTALKRKKKFFLIHETILADLFIVFG